MADTTDSVRELTMSIMDGLASDEHQLSVRNGTNGPAVQVDNSRPSSSNPRARIRYAGAPGRVQQRVLTIGGSPDSPAVTLELQKTTESAMEPLRLRDVAGNTGLSEQYILNLIDRYGILSPHRSGSYGSRTTYEFTQQDVATLERVKRLTGKGIPIREVAGLMENDESYRSVARDLKQALLDFLTQDSFDEEHWQGVISTIASVPSLTEIERLVLHCVEANNHNLADCARRLELESEKEVAAHLRSAYSKLASVLFHVLRMTQE